jgi:phosphatidylethanolamine/phosphatidyl-N-methylethanolamine N-methyltransferase
MLSEALPFLRSWLNSPLTVGAVAPSGRALAKAMTAEISRACAPVIELGPGTGVFTQAMLDRGLEQEDIALIEYGSDFVRRLQVQFPHTHVRWMDAAWLGRFELFGLGKTGAVVSGLPLLAMPPKKVMQILDGAFAHLRPDGAFYQFTYGPMCPVPRVILDRLGLKAARIGGALGNLPPAAVYRIRRRTGRPLRSLSPQQDDRLPTLLLEDA